MFIVILILRLLAEAGAVAAPILVWLFRPRPAQPEAAPPSPAVPPPQPSNRTPLVANFLAIAAFFCLLWPFIPWDLPDEAGLALAAFGLAVVFAGLVFMVWARAVLGASWSFAPKASQATGLATSGPYAWVRHPIYLGMVLLLFGCAAAFANWVAVLAVLLLILPTLVWRARVEEKMLAQIFGEPYTDYRRRTKMIIPYLL